MFICIKIICCNDYLDVFPNNKYLFINYPLINLNFYYNVSKR